MYLVMLPTGVVAGARGPSSMSSTKRKAGPQASCLETGAHENQHGLPLGRAMYLVMLPTGVDAGARGPSSMRREYPAPSGVGGARSCLHSPQTVL